MDHKFLSAFLSQLGFYGHDFELVAERFYSRVYRVPGRVVKVITPHHVLRPEGFGSRSEASSFGTEILTYMEKLAALGVPVSPVAETHIVVSGTRETAEPFVLMDVPDGGASLEGMLARASSHEFIRELAHGMVHVVLHVLRQSRLAGGYLEVGIDPIASNFVIQKDDIATLTYVDFTAPRYFSADKQHRIEYPQPMSESELRAGRWTYYDPCGIAIRWLTDSCRVRPDARQIFLEVLCENLPAKLWKAVRERLPSLRYHPSQWHSVLQDVYGLTDLRDIACGLAAADGADPVVTRQWLQGFFEASRHHPGQPFPDEKLGALRAQLTDRLSAI